ncbi:hypothetical protein [Streptomyces sp. NPDC003635]
MHDEQTEQNAALTQLRERLGNGLARSGLSKTLLARSVDLDHTTVQEAFRAGGPVPSAATVAALARRLGLDEDELLDLQRTAAGEAGPDTPNDHAFGKPIAQWDPRFLGVHPAGPALENGLPGYVSRAHDAALARVVAEVAQGRSRMVVLVGTSSTGKTRACWEAIQPLARQGWRLWYPPTRAEGTVQDVSHVHPRTVLWLNESQNHFGDSQAGEEFATAVHSLLTHPGRGPVLVLGTLWPSYANQYLSLPENGAPDPHNRVRELIAGRTVTIPDAFDESALRAAQALADDGDRLLADALTRCLATGRVAQELAGAPQLLTRYEHSTPAAKALLEAAMDARRLGVGQHLPHDFLADAAIDYLSQPDFDNLTENWAEAAFTDLARRGHGGQTPLHRTRPRPNHRPATRPPSATPPMKPAAGPVYRLADYLEQYGHTTRRLLCPPASFWHAAHSHLSYPDDLNNLSEAARDRYRLQWAHHLCHRAADAGSTNALARLVESREEARDREAAEAFAWECANASSTDGLYRLAAMRRKAGDLESAERLYRAAARGDPFALGPVVAMREEAGDRDGAEAVARQFADEGVPYHLYMLARMRQATNWESAKRLYRAAADAGYTRAEDELREAEARVPKPADTINAMLTGRTRTGKALNGCTAPWRTPATDTPCTDWPKCGRRPATGRTPNGFTGPPALSSPWSPWPGCGRRLGTGRRPSVCTAPPSTPETSTP